MAFDSAVAEKEKATKLGPHDLVFGLDIGGIVRPGEHQTPK